MHDCPVRSHVQNRCRRTCSKPVWSKRALNHLRLFAHHNRSEQRVFCIIYEALDVNAGYVLFVFAGPFFVKRGSSSVAYKMLQRAFFWHIQYRKINTIVCRTFEIPYPLQRGFKVVPFLAARSRLHWLDHCWGTSNCLSASKTNGQPLVMVFCLKKEYA